MVSTESTISEVRIVRTRRYRWPALQLNFWLLIMLIASCTLLGINASFITVQNQINVGVPWYVSCIPSYLNLKIYRFCSLTTFSTKVLPLLGHRSFHLSPLPRPHTLADLAANAPPGHCGYRRLHPLRLVASRAHRYERRVLGAHREC